MRTATITRTDSSDLGTFGDLTTPEGFHCKTGELPDRDNARRISCIPAGTYSVMWRLSPSKGWGYHVQRVPGRDHILFHAANWVGDKALGHKSEVLGCLAPGLSVGVLGGQKAIVSSGAALKALEDHMQRQTFVLAIINATAAT